MTEISNTKIFRTPAWGINHAWARFLIEELYRGGVEEFVVSTGSRSTPLTLAVAELVEACPDIRARVFPDERSAAFFALGYGRATHRAAALVCTSGTAVANYLPALIEASMAVVPMIVVTGDRPHRVRDARTDQVIEQTEIFDPYLRWKFDFPAPNQSFVPDSILSVVSHAVSEANTAPRGPVHLNCSFAKPLLKKPDSETSTYYETNAQLERWSKTNTPFTSYPSGKQVVSEDTLRRLSEEISSSKRGLVFCGAFASPGERECIVELAEKLRWPVVSDITSSLRFFSTKESLITAHADIYLSNQELREKMLPDFILHFGGEAVNNSLQFLLKEAPATYYLINENNFRQDPRRAVSHRINANPFQFAKQLKNFLGQTDSELWSLFNLAENISRNYLSEALEGDSQGSEWKLIPHILEELEEGASIFLGNSLPVREFDRFAPASEKKFLVSCNRGVSGIDGNISTAAGISHGCSRPSLVFTGDVAMLHDLNGLYTLRHSDSPITIVIPNNDGGGVFPFLPTVTEHKNFEEFFVAPHGLKFRDGAKMFGLEYTSCSSAEEMKDSFRKIKASGSKAFIEVFTDRNQNVSEQKAISKEISAQILKTL